MMYIPLTEHSQPRVLMLDFSQEDVAKVQRAGFDARRGATGLIENDRNQFCFPFAVHDAEVVYALVKMDTFKGKNRTVSHESVEEGPFFKDLIRETWQKAGWSILFVAQNTPPDELQDLGLNMLGVTVRDRQHSPSSYVITIATQLANLAQQIELPQTPMSSAQFPHFRGQAVYTSDDEKSKAVTDILRRNLKSAQMSILTCLQPRPSITVFGEDVEPDWLIRDDSVAQNVTALRLNKSVIVDDESEQLIFHYGGILLLPDFGKKNADVALALLQEFIAGGSPHLFDNPQHPWLTKYEPEPVARLLRERDAIVQETANKLESIDYQVEAEKEQYAWLYGLLVSTGDQFAADSATALRFLGFDVEEVDKSLDPNERRREDLHIRDKATGYFALGEAKTTGKGRGASEEFITKTQSHQAKYARENHQEPPPALLIANFAIDLDPSKRTGRFYQPDVADRLEDSGVTALNSVALFDLCQFVLGRQIVPEQVRRFVTCGRHLIPSITLAEVTRFCEKQ